MDGSRRRALGGPVLERLGISSFVTTAALDISAGHSLPRRTTANARSFYYRWVDDRRSRRRIPSYPEVQLPRCSFAISMAIEAAEISQDAGDRRRLRRHFAVCRAPLEIGGRWTDIAPEALEAIRKNARLNDIAIRTRAFRPFRSVEALRFRPHRIQCAADRQGTGRRSGAIDALRSGRSNLQTLLEKAGGFLRQIRAHHLLRLLQHRLRGARRHRPEIPHHRHRGGRQQLGEQSSGGEN